MAATVRSQPYNVILAGPLGTGKTFIFEKLRKEYITFPTDEDKRVSKTRLDQWVHTAMCGEEEIKIRLWDTGGMENNGTLQVTKSYFRQAVGVILVYDKGNLETLSKIEEWIKCARDYCQWSTHVVFALWGNDKGSFGSYSNQVEECHVDGFKGKVNLVDLPDDLCCYVDIKNVATCYQKLLNTLHSRLSNLQGSYQSFSDLQNQDKRVLEESTEVSRKCWC